jgi:hypothetical protein
MSISAALVMSQAFHDFSGYGSFKLDISSNALHLTRR